MASSQVSRSSSFRAAPSPRTFPHPSPRVTAYIPSPRGDGQPVDPNEGVPIGPIGPEELQDPYLSELLSYSLDRLSKEPELLRGESERVQRQMQEVAVGHYRAFITAAQAVREIRSEIQSIDSHLGKLVDEIPELTTGCQQFMEEAHSVLERRRVNKTMLANHPLLADLLEIPQLMDTCVRNGNYDEVLDLQAFVTKMTTMHSKLPIIQRLSSQVQRSTQSMLAHLLTRLRSNIQLPECLRVIGYLRRLGTFSEAEMRLQFLRCREEWLADVIADLDPSSPYEYLKRVTDCHRVHLFDVVTQYRAIFADDSAPLGADVAADAAAAVALWSPDVSRGGVVGGKATGAAKSGVLKSGGGWAGVGLSGVGGWAAGDGGLLYGWAMHRMGLYLSLLSDHLPRIEDGGSLASVLEHSMYCGMSLGRVGLDLRPLLSPLFESCVRSIFHRNIALAIASFQLSLDAHRWVPQPSIGSSFRSSTGDSVDDVAPPYSLMEHPPLAVFVNGILSSLNELRHCAPLALRSQLAADLQSALSAVATALVRFHQTRIVKDSEMVLFLGTCRVFVEVVGPYCAICFGRCFGSPATIVDFKAPCERVSALFGPPPSNAPKTDVVVEASHENDDKATLATDVENKHPPKESSTN